MTVPKYEELFNTAMEAVRNLGGSASIQEMVEEVGRLLELSDDDLAEQHPRGQPIFEYRLAWARSYLKIYGLLENSERGVWSFTDKGSETQSVDPEEVKRYVRATYKRSRPDRRREVTEDEYMAEEWRAELLELLRELDPSQFERLCQRILRESGFSEVEVTGRSGDGGIDGSGVVKLGGLLGFPVLFQCKRYRGSVGASLVRDFRGSMVGRADRGLILTTGVFTREARKEASRDGAPPIDLVDGETVLDKIKELRLGVEVETVETVAINQQWFRSL